MKISAANIYLVKVGSLHPVLIELLTDDGLMGVGEAAVAYGVGGTSAAGMVKDLVEALIGPRPLSDRGALDRMYDHSFWAKGGGTIVFAGISAIEQALWDIKGKALGVPVTNCSEEDYETKCAYTPMDGHTNALARMTMRGRRNDRLARVTPH